MKYSVLTLVVISAVAATLFWATHHSVTPSPTVQTVATPSEPTPPTAPTEAPVPVAPQPQPRAVYVQPVEPETPQPAPAAAPAESAELTAFHHSIQLLVSPQASFEDKQNALKQLRYQGKLDQAIAELQQGALDNPNSAAYPVALGEAYISKIPVSIDPHDPAILGLKADQSFDDALKLDPANWDAGFYKALSMSYWPEQLNKSSEVIQRFTDLIQQQEQQTARPEFARSYVLLGQQYQKSGNSEYAQQVWQRGATLFPANDSLHKLATTH